MDGETRGTCHQSLFSCWNPIKREERSREHQSHTILFACKSDVRCELFGQVDTPHHHDVEEEQLFCGKILRREVKIVVKLDCVKETPSEIFPQIEFFVLPQRSSVPSEPAFGQVKFSWPPYCYAALVPHCVLVEILKLDNFITAVGSWAVDCSLKTISFVGNKIYQKGSELAAPLPELALVLHLLYKGGRYAACVVF